MHKLSTFNKSTQKLKCFILFAECILVKGALRGIVYDLNRANYRFVPNELIDLLNKFEGNTLHELLNFYDLESQTIIKEYFNMLEDEEYIIWVDKEDISLFPKLNLEWDYPAYITNAIIDINVNSNMPFEKIFSELADLNCKTLQIRSYSNFSLDFWNELLKKIDTSIISCVEVYTKYYNEIEGEKLERLFLENLRLSTFVIHSSPKHYLTNIIEHNERKIIYVKDDLELEANENFNHIGYFSVNKSLFTEAQHHHTYFNRKVSIDVNGEIKNCPSLSASFGNINETSISKVFETDEFKKLWNIKKDETLICRDCEFKYMCVDNRMPYKNSDGFYYHKQPCNYNPYAAKWKFE